MSAAGETSFWERMTENVRTNSKMWQNHASDFKFKSIIPQVFMVPMRDGVKLWTIVWVPEFWNSTRATVLIRSPYGTEGTENAAAIYV